jgi:hypothetical protein
MNSNKFVKGYMPSISMYCITRKMVQLHNAKVDKYNYIEKDFKKMPILESTKVYIIGASVLAGYVVWPYFLLNDLNNIEINVRKFSAYDYEKLSKITTEIDYILN